MFELTWEQDSENRRNIGLLKIEGDVTVEHAQDLKEVLQRGMENLDQLRIDCSEVAHLDFFTLQLLCSSHRTWTAHKKRLGIDGANSPALQQAVHRAGFFRHCGCAFCLEGDRCLWLAPDAAET